MVLKCRPVGFIYHGIALLQLMIDVVYGAVFNPADPDLILVIGKEHLGWWVVYPENSAIQLQRKADYQVGVRERERELERGWREEGEKEEGRE